MKISTPWRVVREENVHPYIVDRDGRLVLTVNGDTMEESVELADALVKTVNRGEHVTCAYCGWFAGTQDEIRSSEEEKELCRRHELECPEHPMAALREQNERLLEDSAILAKIRRMAAPAREGRINPGGHGSVARGVRWAAWVLTEAERGTRGSS